MTLAERAAAHMVLDDPLPVAQLVEAPRQSGAHDQAAALAERRAAAHSTLDDPRSLARLLEVGAQAGRRPRPHQRPEAGWQRAARATALRHPADRALRRRDIRTTHHQRPTAQVATHQMASA